MATVTGLSASKYYVNNPIWLEADNTGSSSDSFDLIVSSNSVLLFQGKFYTYENKAYIDMAEIMKGLMPEPKHPINPVSGQVITDNSIYVQIYLLGFAPSVRFFRGGEDSQRSNVQVPNNAVLSESEKIPVWQGYPSAKYYLNSSNEIIYTDILTNAEIERRKSVTCNPVFLRFLNTKGGYSFWLFDEWDVQKKTTKGKRIERRGNDLDLGLTADHTLQLSTRCEERYVSTLRALLQSPEVHVYQLQNILTDSNPTFVQSFVWTQIYNDGGSMQWNKAESVHEFDFKFDLNLKTNPTLIW